MFGARQFSVVYDWDGAKTRRIKILKIGVSGSGIPAALSASGSSTGKCQPHLHLDTPMHAAYSGSTAIVLEPFTNRALTKS